MPRPTAAATYSGLVLQALRRFPDREAFRHAGRSTSYGEALDALGRYVAVLE